MSKLSSHRNAALLVDAWLFSPINNNMTFDNEQTWKMVLRFQRWSLKLSGAIVHRLKNIDLTTIKVNFGGQLLNKNGDDPNTYKRMCSRKDFNFWLIVIRARDYPTGSLRCGEGFTLGISPNFRQDAHTWNVFLIHQLCGQVWVKSRQAAIAIAVNFGR